MLSYIRNEIVFIEKSINEQTTRMEIFERCRILGLTDFGLLILGMPNPEFPKISKILPRMASEEVQKSWTGSSGSTLLAQTLDFVRSLSYNYTKYTGNTLEARKILDFGCGYGRIARLMYYFTSEDNFHAMDPWDKSLEICNQDGLTKNFLLSDYLPLTLPAEEKSFDLIFAFSVFTHLSERAIRTNLNTISKYIKPDGLIVITIRPVEYWDIDAHAIKGGGGRGDS
ncbi:hypothetical protein AGMMS50256_29730 [Betaproteobacteria bacterium]|nr:hypothetical protein AGMMS50256_29730 [Betaproteobacteria bacterium]